MENQKINFWNFAYNSYCKHFAVLLAVTLCLFYYVFFSIPGLIKPIMFIIPLLLCGFFGQQENSSDFFISTALYRKFIIAFIILFALNFLYLTKIKLNERIYIKDTIIFIAIPLCFAIRKKIFLSQLNTLKKSLFISSLLIMSLSLVFFALSFSSKSRYDFYIMGFLKTMSDSLALVIFSSLYLMGQTLKKQNSWLIGFQFVLQIILSIIIFRSLKIIESTLWVTFNILFLYHLITYFKKNNFKVKLQVGFVLLSFFLYYYLGVITKILRYFGLTSYSGNLTYLDRTLGIMKSGEEYHIISFYDSYGFLACIPLYFLIYLPMIIGLWALYKKKTIHNYIGELYVVLFFTFSSIHYDTILRWPNLFIYQIMSLSALCTYLINKDSGLSANNK